ncbi:MAG: D-2-hydroxyacid dehydrogenase [Microlunatus sp.]|nr:D-2-hydroxyacid dehydrogenase [Microlunatus sp.]
MAETILITSYFEPSLVGRLRQAWPGEVLYDPDLVPHPRFLGDWFGERPDLDAESENRWREMLARAEILLGFDWLQPDQTRTNSPNLRWIQATFSGIGGFVDRLNLSDSEVVITTAAGVQAIPLAEFALAGALHFLRGIPGIRARQAARRWQRYSARALAGSAVTVVGLGEIGRRTAASFATLGARVTGLARPGGSRPDLPGVEILDSTMLDKIISHTDILVLATPQTSATTGMISGDLIRSLPDGAVIINVGRGTVLDQAALEDVLINGLPNGGRLGGVALDVTDPEPLPEDSPLWDRDDVLISPHSAAVLASEKASLIDLFIDNLNRWQDDQPLRNVFRPELGY